MKFVQAKYRYQGGNVPEMVVIHDMEFPKKAGAAEWCANYFQNPEHGKSAHYAVDDQEVIQMVDEADGAWHTPGFLGGREINRFSVGIEHAGFANQTEAQWLDGYSKPELLRSAALVADICKRHNIPIRFLSAADLQAGETHGITGHWQCTQASGSGDHTDPGPNFPWDWYIAEVKKAAGFSPMVKALAFVLVAGALWVGYRHYKGKPLVPTGIRLPHIPIPRFG